MIPATFTPAHMARAFELRHGGQHTLAWWKVAAILTIEGVSIHHKTLRRYARLAQMYGKTAWHDDWDCFGE